MRKLLFIFGLFLTVLSYSQIDTVAIIGEDPNNMGGDSRKDAYNTFNLNDQALNASILLNDAELASLAARADITESQLWDSLGYFNVKSPHRGVAGAVGDSTDATEAFRATILAAGSQKVIVPIGVYVISDSMYTQLSPHLIGESSDKTFGESSKIVLVRNKPFLYVDSLSGSPYGTGGNVENIYIYGSNNADSSRQHGIVFNANKRWTVDNCSFSRLGGNAVKLGDDNDAVMITVKNSHFSYNYGSLIYGRKTDDIAVNAIDIFWNHMYANYGDCIDVVGHDVNAIGNKIEFNEGVAIIVNPIDQSGINCFSVGNSIRRNRLEDNAGGGILIYQEFVSGSENHLNYGTDITDNYFGNTLASHDNPDATALITVVQGPDGSNSSYLRDFKIGRNTIVSSTSLPHVDLGGDGSGGVKEDTEVWVKEEADVSAYYLNMGSATINYDGMLIHKPTPTGLDANGFAAADIHPVAYVSFSGDLDITANPQIVAAQVDGYIMVIINGDADGDLTLNDGTGLDLNAATIVMQPDDMIMLMWVEAENVWMQMAPVSDNNP